MRPAAARIDLAALPVTAFAAVMGLTGLGLAWRRAVPVLGAPPAVGESLLAAGALLFALLALAYAFKLARHAALVREEFAHPQTSCFFPAISIALMLLAVAALPYGEALARVVWSAGLVLQLAFAVVLMGRWISRDHAMGQAGPAWFLPVVGSIIAPNAGVTLGHVELSWFFYSFGLVFWLVLFPILLNRLMFHEGLPPKGVPTLFILLAPPALACIGWAELQGGALDAPGRLFFFASLFLALVWLSLWRIFLILPFALSWWAYTFPSTALAIAGLIYHREVQHPASAALAMALLAGASALVLIVLVRTVRAGVASSPAPA